MSYPHAAQRAGANTLSKLLSDIEISGDVSKISRGKSPSERSGKLAQRINLLLEQGSQANENGDYAEALRLHFEAWKLDEYNLTSIKHLAHSLNYVGARAKALELFELALARNPEDPDVAGLLGQVAIDLEMWEQAAALNRIYINANPDKELGYNNLATALRHMERFDEAIAFLQDVLPLFPDSSPLWNILGISVTLRDGLETAQPFYDEALRLDPKNWQILNNLAKSYGEIGEYDKVIDYGKRAVKQRFNQPECHIGYAFGLFGTGQIKKGWEEYDWRQHPNRNQGVKWVHGLKRWSGEDLEGKSIVICPEQGVGDEILFSNAIPDVIQSASQVYIGCDKRLIPLFKRSFPQAIIGAYSDKRHNAFRYRLLPFLDDLGVQPDYYIEAGSLGLYYRDSLTAFDTVDGGFLKADEQSVEEWRSKLQQLGPGLKVGICWRSGLRTAERNIWYPELERWKDILKTPDCHFINLQYGDCAEELTYFKDTCGVEVYDPDGIDLRADLDACAALTQACDIVISIGAAPGMMAYGVNTPIIWMFPYTPWWAFGETSKTPFYKNARIIAPETPRDWQEVCAQAAHWLAKAAQYDGVITPTFFK